MTRQVMALFAVLGLLGVATPSSAADMPAWLVDASRRSSPALEADADAVVLHDEEHVTVQADGRLLTRRKYAVRVLTKDGAPAAAMREVYERGAAEIRSLRGWVQVDGRVKELGKAETADLALVDNDVYNEARICVLALDQPVTPGLVFGGE